MVQYKKKIKGLVRILYMRKCKEHKVSAHTQGLRTSNDKYDIASMATDDLPDFETTIRMHIRIALLPR